MNRFLRDERGVSMPYFALSIFVLVGVGALAIDVPRMLTTTTEMQSAADAAALAGAHQLNRTDGARARARAAAAQVLQNTASFGERGVVTMTESDCGAVAAESACIRFLKSLPADDAQPIDSTHVANSDEEARFIQVVVGQNPVKGIFASVLSRQISETEIGASAVAGNDALICAIPPMFMCNPAEPPGNTDKDYPFDAAALKGIQFQIFASGKDFLPGNFGLLCPAGAEDTSSGSDCGASIVQEALASTGGTCVRRAAITTKPGVNFAKVVSGYNLRFDNWDSQTKDWIADPKFYPAQNVTQGGGAIATQGQKCERAAPDPAKGEAAMALPRDDCFAAGTCAWMGDGAWNRDAYFRVNHYDPVAGNANIPASLGATPTRFEVYRWEVEQNHTVSPGASTADGATTVEEGEIISGNHPTRQCYGGSFPPNIDYVYGGVNDLDLLKDRRVMPVAVVNCQAEGGSGRFTLDNPDFAFLFLTEPATGNGNGIQMWIEVLGKLDGETLDSLTHDVVQLYRR